MTNVGEQIQNLDDRGRYFGLKVIKVIMIFLVFVLIPLIQRVIEKIVRFSTALDRLAFKMGRKLQL
jgi:hypothetical protein